MLLLMENACTITNWGLGEGVKGIDFADLKDS